MIKLVTDESLKHNLEEIVRLGAKKMFMQALEAEISDVIHKLKNEVDDKGNRLVVRNGKSKKKINNFRLSGCRVNRKKEKSFDVMSIMMNFRNVVK